MRNRWIGILIGSILIVLVIWSAVAAYRAITAVRSLRDSQNEIELILDQGLMRVNPADLQNLVTSVREDVLTLRATAGPLVGVSPLFSWLPKYGSLMAYGPELMEMADLGSAAGVHAVRAASPALIALQENDLDAVMAIPAVVHSLESSSQGFALAAADLQEVALIRETIKETNDWPWEPQRLLAELDSALPVIQDALSIGQALPEFLGNGQQRTYLLLAQNEDELRPTGGFISGAGILVIEDGNIVSIDFSNANLIDDWQNKPYEFPPLPFYEFMGMDIFLFRDSNFWPDFPTSAETAMQLYSYGQEVPLDGVIAFNQKFVQLLLEAIGPLQIPELNLTVNSNNVVETMREEWGPADGQTDWIDQRKAFMGPFANAFMSRMTGDLESIELKELALMVHQAIEQRDLQLFMREPAVAEALADAGWDGQLTVYPTQDYLMIVETNLGFNKANAAIDRAVVYTVTLDETGHGSAALSIDYAHSRGSAQERCQHGTIYNVDTQYEDLIADCYWNYLRVLVPQGSRLNSSSAHPVPADHLLVDQPWDGQARAYDNRDEGYSYFDNFLLLPPGEATTVAFDYLLPEVVASDQDGINVYRLAVDKQSGVTSFPLKITITLPGGSEFVASSHVPSSINGRNINFEFELLQDTQIDVQYR